MDCIKFICMHVQKTNLPKIRTTLCYPVFDPIHMNPSRTRVRLMQIAFGCGTIYKARVRGTSIDHEKEIDSR